MTSIVLVGANCEATGHPTECTEPAPGAVTSTSSSSLSINGTDIYSEDTADMHFDSHAHSYIDTNADGIPDTCSDMQSHDLDPDQSHSITLNSTPIYLVGDSTTDPGSGGTATILDSGGNSTVTINN